MTDHQLKPFEQVNVGEGKDRLQIFEEEGFAAIKDGFPVKIPTLRRCPKAIPTACG